MSEKLHCVIVDAGATKTDFAVLEDRNLVHRFFSSGINANYSEDEFIDGVFAQFMSSLPEEMKSVDDFIYYGAGCSTDQNASRISRRIKKYFPGARSRVLSDLMEACHALCGRNKGLVGILGTGSSSCLYDGSKVIMQAPSLGYMLGDEGSGTHLGKKLIYHYLMERLPAYLRRKLETEFDINPAKVIQRIYREAAPNRFFASFAPFMQQHIEDAFIQQICKASFAEFFDCQIAYYDTNDYDKLHLTGSIAYHFRAQLAEVATAKGVSLGTVVAAPMNDLLKYYTSDL